MARTLRAQAREISAELDRLSRQFRIRHSLKVVRGNYMNTVLSLTGGTDVVFMNKEIGNYKKRMRIQQADVMRAPVRLAQKHHAVWVIYAGSGGCNRALITAHDIALKENRDLIILLLAPTVDEARILRQQTDSLLQDTTVRILYTFSPDPDDDALIRQLENSVCGLIVIHRNGGSGSDRLTRLLLRELECPVVLVP